MDLAAGDDRVRRVEALPEPVRALGPAAAAVSDDAVILTWRDDRCYPYGYGLVLLADEAQGPEARLRASDRSFRRNLELTRGIWSYYLFH